MNAGAASALPGVRGIGVDLVENARMRAALQRWGARFTGRIFRPSERAYCDGRAQPAAHYAGRFAVKEAVSKAFGAGGRAQLYWHDVEVVRHAVTGAPAVRLSARGQRLARRRGVGGILVSLSHTRHYAVALALLVGAKEGA